MLAAAGTAPAAETAGDDAADDWEVVGKAPAEEATIRGVFDGVGRVVPEADPRGGSFDTGVAGSAAVGELLLVAAAGEAALAAVAAAEGVDADVVADDVATGDLAVIVAGGVDGAPPDSADAAATAEAPGFHVQVTGVQSHESW